MDASFYAIEERAVDAAEVSRVAELHVAHHGAWLAGKPVAAHTVAAFGACRAAAARSGLEVIVDAGCGTGRSTRRIAERHPDAFVVGVDRSAERLGRHGDPLPANAFLLRAELGDFWRLANDREGGGDCGGGGLAVRETFLLYPNPYPKAAHLKRRWQGHACLPALLGAAGERLTLRASWKTYLDEFALAATVAAACGDPGASRLVAGGVDGPRRLAAPAPGDAMTNFAGKYAAAGVPVFELVLGGGEKSGGGPKT